MLSKGDATHSTQLLVTPPHQIPRDWMGWEKRCYSFTLLSTCRQRAKPGRLQKVSPGKGGFLQGDLFVSRKDVYVNWADSYWTGGTATSGSVLGSLLGSRKSSPLHYHLRCSRKDEKQAWPVSAFWSPRLCCLTVRPVKGETQGEPRTITPHLL